MYKTESLSHDATRLLFNKFNIFTVHSYKTGNKTLYKYNYNCSANTISAVMHAFNDIIVRKHHQKLQEYFENESGPRKVMYASNLPVKLEATTGISCTLKHAEDTYKALKAKGTVQVYTVHCVY